VLIDGDIRVVRRRQASLDTFRGLALALTIFISYGGGGREGVFSSSGMHRYSCCNQPQGI
jgi:hypothetical protein